MDLPKALKILRIFFAIPVLTLTLAVSGANAEELDPVKLIKAMSKEIAALDSFILQGDTYVDARLPEGQLIEHSAQITLRVVRPGFFRLSNNNLETVKEIYFDEGTITIYDSKTGFYGQNKMPSEVKTPLIYAIDNLGIDAPLLDILDEGLTDDLLKQATEVQYLGESLIRDNIYHHIGLRLPEIDMQLWVATGKQPLPGKMVLSAKWEGGAPRTVSFIDWQVNPTIPKADFKFDAPKGAIKIEIETNP